MNSMGVFECGVRVIEFFFFFLSKGRCRGGGGEEEGEDGGGFGNSGLARGGGC